MDPLPPTANAVTLVLAAQAVAGISNYALTLDGLTLAKILNGDITTCAGPRMRWTELAPLSRCLHKWPV